MQLLRRVWIGAAALALIQGFLLVTTAWDKSDTIDEPIYLATGARQVERLSVTHNCDLPALPRWAYGVALRVVDPALLDPNSKGGRHPLWSRDNRRLRRNLMAARATTILVTVAGGLFLWSAARRFGEPTGLVAHTLWVFSPSVLAHGSLATVDGWATAMICAALWATVRVAEKPTAARVAVAGAVLGLAAAAKVTTLAAVPVVLAVLAWRSQAATRDLPGRSRAAATAGRMAAFAGGFLITLSAIYAFRFSTIDTSMPCGRASGLPQYVIGPVPFGPWIEGLLMQWQHGRGGHLSYLFGEVRSTGWWWFYLAALALKTTIGAQALLLLRLASWFKSPPDRRSLFVDAALLAFPVLLVTAMSLGAAQNGLKYVLPAFPPAMVWAARGVVDVSRAFGRRGLGVLVLCLAAAAGEALAYHPHHLMFFNLWAGGPEGGPRYLINGDDWGQDQRRLGEWQRNHRPWRLFYTYYNGDPPHWGIDYEPPPCEPRPGFYALHAVEVHRPKRIEPGCLDWLTVEPPDARLGYSIYLYQVNKPRIERLQEERGRIAPFWRSGPPR
jgi:hypothetical protein